MKTRFTVENNKLLSESENISSELEEWIMFFDKFNINYELQNRGGWWQIRVDNCGLGSTGIEFEFKSDETFDDYYVVI